MGAFYFNEGAEIKRVVNAMDMETYKKEGKSVEEKLAAKYQQAVPYFERALKVKKDEENASVIELTTNAYSSNKNVDSLNCCYCNHKFRACK